MTSLMILTLFVITMKFQIIQMEFSDKDDYFNHDVNALPEFIVDERLFTTKKPYDRLKNPPWITERTTKNKSTDKTISKFTPVTVTFDSKVYWVHVQPPNVEVIRSNKKNDTNTLLPIWTSKSITQASTGIITISTTKAPIGTRTESTTKPTTTASPRPTTTAYSRTTSIQTSTSPSKTITRSTTTIKPIPKSTTTSTVTSTIKVSTTAKSRYITFTINTSPVVPTMTIPWHPLTEITNKINEEAMKTATGISGIAYYAVTYTAPSTTTMKPNSTPTSTKTPTLVTSIEANFNRIRPETDTYTVPSTRSTVFLDLTLKRMGIHDDEEIEARDERNQTMNNPEAGREVVDEKTQTTNKLQDKDVIEYLVLETEPFSKFLELLMKQLAVMESVHAAKFFKTFARQLAVLMNSGRFDALGPVTMTFLQDAMKSFQFPVDHKQRLLSMAHNILANRNDTLGPELNSLLDYMDMLYAVTAEVHMQRILSETIAYPNTSKTAEEITEGFLEDVILNPLERIRGTTQGNKLLAAIADVIANKKADLNARRVFIGSDYDFHKINKRGRSSHNYRSHRRRRPKFVITKNDGKILLPDGFGEIQITQRPEEDRQIVYSKNKEDANDFFSPDITIFTDTKFSSTSENRGKTKMYSLDVVKRRQEVPKHGRNVNKEVNGYKKYFGESYNSYNNIRQNNKVHNPFRTLLYGKYRKDRFESDYTQKETPMKAYFQRTRPTTKASESTVELTTYEYKKIQYNLDKQFTHESNLYHKQKLKLDSERDKNKIKSFVRESILISNKQNSKEESEDTNSDKEFTTTSKLRHRKKPKVTTVKSSKNFTKPSKNININKSETTNKDTETTKSELKEANISLKHFYFKPVLIQNKSGVSNEFVSIEFDGEPNVIDFSMKVKLKKPRTHPTPHKAIRKQKETETSGTTTSPSTNALRVLNPYKMDIYFKNKSTEHDDKNDKADDKESTSADSDSSSSTNSGESGLSLEEEKDSQPQVFGKLHKIRNNVHKKEILRSKKHGNAKKHHHKRKHVKHKGHHTNRGKHGKKHNYKYLQTYLKKKIHARKKRIKHKMKHLKDKRIIGKNFEIAFDASSGDSDENHLIDVTIVERARDGKRATISLVNTDKKLRSSDSSITSEEDTKNTTTKREKTSSVSEKGKHERKQKLKTSTIATPTVVTEDLFNLGNPNEVENNEKHDLEPTKVKNGNSHQVTNKAKPSTKRNEETAYPKDSRKNKRISPNVNAFRNLLKMANENRKRKKLSPMLIQINNVANNRSKAKSFGQLKNKVGTVNRRFFPIQVFNDSEYSDEEDELKNNLYDAFRHKDEVYYRRNMRHELPLKDELKEESDITDEEIVLKQNIYKAIKENNRRSGAINNI